MELQRRFAEAVEDDSDEDPKADPAEDYPNRGGAQLGRAVGGSVL